MVESSSNPNHLSLPSWRRQGVFVGRQHELEALNAALGDVATGGQGGLVFITGEAGIGKTRLAAELQIQALAHGCRWLEGRYDKEGSIPLKPYAEAMRAFLSSEPAGSLAALAGPYSTEIARAFPAVSADLDPTSQVPNPVGEDPAATRQRLLEAICHLFFSMASQQPLLLFLDDALPGHSPGPVPAQRVGLPSVHPSPVFSWPLTRSGSASVPLPKNRLTELALRPTRSSAPASLDQVLAPVTGPGIQRGIQVGGPREAGSYTVDMLLKVKLEMVVREDQSQQAIDIICEHAVTGNIGDGKIFISPVSNYPYL